MTVTWDRYPLQGCELRVFGRMHRHTVRWSCSWRVADGKTLLPAVVTDAVAAADVVVAAVGSIEDQEHLAVVESLLPPAVGAGVAEDATGIPQQSGTS